METKNLLWMFVIILVILQFTGNINFLGATTSGDEIGTKVMDTLTTMFNTILDKAMENPLLAIALVVALFLIITSKN